MGPTRQKIFQILPSRIAKPRATAYGLENVSFLGQNLWIDLPLHIKESLNVKHFKKKLSFGILLVAADYVRVIL